MNVIIQDIAYAFPDNCVTNDDYKRENPDWNMAKLTPKTGVQARFIAGPEETAFTLSLKACDKLFEKYDKNTIDTVIFCTQSPDYIMPANAYLIHSHYNLPQHVIAFDITQACSGYIYGLLLSKSMIISGTSKNILLINADTYSKYINAKDRSTRVIFGDGASASIITSTTDDRGIIDFEIASSGKEYKNFYIPDGAAKTPYAKSDHSLKDDGNGNFRTEMDIHMNGLGVLSFFKTMVPRQIKQLLIKNNLDLKDINLFVFHQASQIAIDSISSILRLEKSKVFTNIQNLGNLVSASIPVALKMAIDEKKINKGDFVLLSGFGVGLSWGTCLIKY